MNRNLLNLVLLLLVAGLTWLAIQQPGKTPEAQPARMTPLERDGIDRIAIQRGNGDDLNLLTLERRGVHWWLTGNPELPADPTQVDMLLTLATTPALRSYALNELEPAKLGLDPPQLRVRFNDIQLGFGTTTPMDNLRYVLAGDRIHLIDDRYQHVLTGSRTQLASRKLLPESVGILAIQLPQVSLKQTADGGWTLTPEDFAVSADAIQKLVDAWRRASALWVRAYQTDANAAEDSTTQTVTIELADGKLLRFDLQRSGDEVSFVRPDLGIQYNLAAQSAAALLTLESATSPAETADTPAPATD